MGAPWTFTTRTDPLPMSQETIMMIRISGAHDDHAARPDDDIRPGAHCRMCGRMVDVTADGRWFHV